MDHTNAGGGGGGGGSSSSSSSSSSIVTITIIWAKKLKIMWTELRVQTRPVRSFAGIEAAKTQVKVFALQTANASSNNETITSSTPIPATQVCQQMHLY